MDRTDEKIILRLGNLEAVRYLKKNYSKISAGANKLLLYMSWLYPRGKADIRGMYTKSELKLMLGLYEGRRITKLDIDPEFIVTLMSAAEKMKRIGKKQGVDIDQLAKKVLKMDVLQSFALVHWCEIYWSEKKDEKTHLEEIL